ncbi:mercury(II) reductase, partial [Pseudonocardia sp. KRD-182]|uniref:mercury(II) reductase n=1 Tax=Pseudonocardia oceani TaxID=2792013 RepID=UPI001C5C31AE
MNDTPLLDLAVIGSGGAAMAAAIAARQAGKTVVLIEQATLGGTCVNVGCVPSKTLLAAAGARHAALNNPFPGAPTSAGPVDLAALVEQKDELVGRLRQGKYAAVADAHGFEVRPGRARFTGPDTLEVDGTPLPARAYLIATGAEPARPDLPGIDEIDWLSSTTAMELAELPESLVVIGGGYVGMEQAQLFAHLGSRVTLIGRLAPAAEPELAEVLRGVFADDGITVISDRATAVATEGGQAVVSTRSGRLASGARVLVATGRAPRTPELELDAAGVKTDDRGFVVVDAQQATCNPRIYAAGDVSGAPQYVYVAAATGRVAALNATGAAGARPATVDYTGMPGVVFTRPQLGTAGLTEAQALAAGYRCECRVLSLSDVPRALANRDTRGVVKLVADTTTGRLLGVHAAADGAGEIMLAATYAIKARMTVDEMADTWAPYLTMAESLRI